jgi:hypothetical protein
LVIPKHHGAKLTDIPDDSLLEILPVVKKLITATGATDYNVLQNNGQVAHQAVDHVCSLSREDVYIESMDLGKRFICIEGLYQDWAN